VDQESPTGRPGVSGEEPREGQPPKPLLEAMVRLWAEQGRTAEVDVAGVSMSGRTSSGFRTRGDATKGFDPNPLPDDDVLGVVTHLLWSDREVDLEGAGAGLLRWLLGVVSLMAGWIRLSPPGPLPGTRLLPRIRDILAAPVYRLFLRGSFRAYVLFSRAEKRHG